MFIRPNNFRRLALPRGSIQKAFQLVHTREAHLEAKFRLSTRFARRSLARRVFSGASRYAIKFKTFPSKISADATFNLGQCLDSGLPVVYALFSSTGESVIVDGT